MNHQNTYYITASNFRKLIYRSVVKIDRPISEVYKEIYEGADLAPFLNHKEARKVRKSMIFLQEADAVLIAMEKANLEQQKQQNSLDSHSKFLFVSGPPKYHVNNACETLSKDFDNFEVPEEIEARGSAEIRSFRKFAQQNRKLLGEGREDVFLLRLKNKFNLISHMGRVSLPNSGGVTAPVADASVGLDGLTSKIEELIEKLESFKTTEEGKMAIKAYMYASVSTLTDSRNLTDAASNLLENKRDLINLVLEYHVHKHKGGNVSFSADLLALHGFEPCGTCCGAVFDLPLHQ